MSRIQRQLKIIDESNTKSNDASLKESEVLEKETRKNRYISPQTRSPNRLRPSRSPSTEDIMKFPYSQYKTEKIKQEINEIKQIFLKSKIQNPSLEEKYSFSLKKDNQSTLSSDKEDNDFDSAVPSPRKYKSIFDGYYRVNKEKIKEIRIKNKKSRIPTQTLVKQYNHENDIDYKIFMEQLSEYPNKKIKQWKQLY